MNASVRIQLVQLSDGQKLMRIEDDATGLSVETKLSPEAPIAAQKAKLLRLFEAMLVSDSAAA